METTSTKNAHWIRERKKTTENKQTNEGNAEKYLQILNIHYIQTHGSPGGGVWGGGGGGGEPSNVPSVVRHAAEMEDGGGEWSRTVWMLIDSSVGHH